MTTAKRPALAKAVTVSLEAMEAEMRAIADQVVTPPTARSQIRIADNLRAREGYDAELRDYDNRKSLLDDIYRNALDAIETNRLDIIACRDLCPVAPVPAAESNVTQLRVAGAAE